MELLKSSAFATGVFFGLLIVVLIVRFANRNKKIKTEYDERQQIIRGKSYTYACYTLAAYEFIMTFLSMGGILESIPIEYYNFHLFGIYIGGIVLAVHSIWNGAYWGLNNNIKRYTVVFIILFLINLMPVVLTIINGVKTINGIIMFPFVNAACLLLFVALGIALIARKRLDDRMKEEEDCA